MQVQAQVHDVRLETPAPEPLSSTAEDSLQGFQDAVSELKDGETVEEEPESTALLAHLTKQKPLPPGDVRRLVSQTHKKPIPISGVQTPLETSRLAPAGKDKKVIIVDGKKYIQSNVHRVKYKIDNVTAADAEQASLVDRGANGSMAGADV